MPTPDVVVIGAGVIGASVAYHLARDGRARVRVLERGPRPGEGSTGKATGGFRAQFGSEVNVRLSLLSREKLLRFRDEVGVDPGFQQAGYLFLAERPSTLAALRAALDVQRRAGFADARPVDVHEIRELNPAVRTEPLCGGVYGPSDGFLRPLEILRGYVEAARRLGVAFEFGAPCLGFRRAGQRITAVETARALVPAGAVVNAAGPWAAPVAALAGAAIPVVPLRRQVAETEPFDRLPPGMPMTIFAEDGFHLRVRNGRVLLLMPDAPRTSDPYEATVEPAWLQQVVERARAAVPCLADAVVRPERAWAGLYEMSPDSHALLGPAPGVENLFLASGSSGHGVMHAPALGQLLAEIILDGQASSLDIHALRPSRFAEGDPNPGSVIL